MKKKLPSYHYMLSNYPTHGTLDEIKAEIGGAVDQEHYKNSCIMRISKALNYSGNHIPPDSSLFRTKRGKDGLNYGLRVGEFWNYMHRTYGKPTIHSPRGKKANWEDFSGVSGIIGFRVKFKDATGHFSLYSGYRVVYGGDKYDYFGIAYEAALWAA